LSAFAEATTRFKPALRNGEQGAVRLAGDIYLFEGRAAVEMCDECAQAPSSRVFPTKADADSEIPTEAGR
jgi:hypothetical protein